MFFRTFFIALQSVRAREYAEAHSFSCFAVCPRAAIVQSAVLLKS